jgi:putative sigma-54 modulation protein
VDLQIRGHDIVVTDSLRSFIDRRAAKLDHLVDRVVDAKLELRKHHHRAGGDITTAQLTIRTGRHILRAEERARDPQAAVDQAIDKLVRQVRRFHDRRTDRKGPRPEPALALGEAPAEAPEADLEDELEELDELDETETPRRNGDVRTKRFLLKPMAVDEAIEQMELLGHDFYLFQNADEEQLNVIYRRRDGTYGLLAPSR